MITFARIVARGSPHLAFWGGTSFVLATFARLYFSGVDRTAFALTDALGLHRATRIVLDSYVDLSYGLWRIPVTASAGSIVGMLLLALGAYRAGILGLGRSLLLVAFGWLWMGVLKESDIDSILLGIAGCIVLVPLGIRVLRRRIPYLDTTATIVPDMTGRKPKLISW